MNPCICGNAIVQPDTGRNKQQQQSTIEQANTYVQRLYRHHGSIPIARLACAVADESGIVRGVFALVVHIFSTFITY